MLPRLASRCLASPRLASPRAASPRLASPRGAGGRRSDKMIIDSRIPFRNLVFWGFPLFKIEFGYLLSVCSAGGQAGWFPSHPGSHRGRAEGARNVYFYPTASVFVNSISFLCDSRKRMPSGKNKRFARPPRAQDGSGSHPTCPLAKQMDCRN